MRQRELTEREQRAVNLCRRFEEAVDNRQMLITLWANKETVEALQKAEAVLKAFKVNSYQLDSAKGDYRVSWTLHEFNRYLHWVLGLVGMTLMMDGSIRTEDGLTVTNEYAQ